MLSLLLIKPQPWIWLLRVLIAGAVFSGIAYLLMGGNEVLEQLMHSSTLPMWAWLVITCSLYAMVLMIPFAPGLELGLLIMAMFGIPGIIGAWTATVIGLCMAFIVGQLTRDSRLISAVKRKFLSHEGKSKAIRWIRKRLAQFPYVSLALLLNVPGNMVIGGGGGIALSAGALGNLSLSRFFITVVMACGVVPMMLIIGVFINRGL